MELSEKVQKKRFDAMKAGLCYQRISQPHEIVHSYKEDHNYDTPCNWWAVKALAKPLKFIFGTYETRSPADVHPTQIIFDPGEYHRIMTSRKMNESLAYSQGFYKDEQSEDRDNDKEPLSEEQREIWEKAIDYLNSYKLARIAHNGHKNELIWRKLVVEKAAKRFRSLFLQHVKQNVVILQWLHNKLLDELDEYFLQAYVEMCQYLKGKIPATMNRVLSNATTLRVDVSKAFSGKAWDPITPQLLSRHLKPFPDKPNLLLIPGWVTSSRLIKRWIRHLSDLGSVFTVELCSDVNDALLVKNLDRDLAITKGKVRQLKEEYPGKRLILFGFNSGAALACQVARSDRVSAVVCLGFPSRTIDGLRDLSTRDVLLNLPSPVLFIVGQKAKTSNVEEMEKIRGRIRTGNCLIVVNGADDQLRMDNTNLTKEGVTQVVVDRCIVEEIVEFLEIITLYPENFIKNAKKLTAAERIGESAVRGTHESSDDLTSGTDSSATSEIDDSSSGTDDTCETVPRPNKRPRGGARGRPRGRGRGARARTSGETCRGATGGARRGRKKKHDDTSMDGVFKRPFPPMKVGVAGSIGLNSSQQWGFDSNVTAEIAHCDNYIDNLVEIMKLEDDISNEASTVTEEDEKALAHLTIDDYF